MTSGSLQRRLAAVLAISLVLQGTGAGVLSSRALAAPDVPKLLLVPLIRGEGATDKQAQKFSALLQADLETRDDTLKLVPLAVPAPEEKKAPASGAGAQTVEKALEVIGEGQTRLNELKFEEAVGLLNRGIELMQSEPAHALYDRLLDAYISLAVAHFRVGDEKKAQAALFAVARLSPGYSLPEGKFPPVFTRELEKMKRRAAKAVKGTVIIEGPMGATAYLDGRDLGMVPVTEDGVAVGVHFVKVEGAKGELFGQPLDLKGSSAKVKAVFTGAPAQPAQASEPQHPLPTPVLDANAVYRLVQACKAAGTEWAIVGQVYRSADLQLSAAAALFSVKQQAFSVAPIVVFDQELLTANVEAFKLADQLVSRMSKFEPAPLPQKLGGKAATVVAAASKEPPKEVEVTPEVTTRKVVVAQTDEPKREEGGGVRALKNRSLVEGESSSVDPIDLGPIEKRKKPQVEEGGVAWWVWAAAGVAVVGAAGGTYYGISQATKPVSGTVTARW